MTIKVKEKIWNSIRKTVSSWQSEPCILLKHLVGDIAFWASALGVLLAAFIYLFFVLFVSQLTRDEFLPEWLLNMQSHDSREKLF